MEFLEQLSKFSQSKEKLSYTLLIHGFINEELINQIKKKLENINKTIKSQFNKKIINDRIFSLITHLESCFKLNDSINCIFLIDSNVNRIDLPKSAIKFCNEWNIPKFFMDYESFFKVRYLIDLFSTNNCKIVFRFDKSNYFVIKIDYTKSKVIETHSNMDESLVIDCIKKHNPTVICGQNLVLKKLESNKSIAENHFIIQKNINNEELMKYVEIKSSKDNQEIFRKEFLDNINNPSVMDKLIFGRQEISLAIQNYMVKKLFINPKMLEILKQNVDSSTLNFEIVTIKSVESGDYGQKLNKDYGGMVAIKYY